MNEDVRVEGNENGNDGPKDIPNYPISELEKVQTELNFMHKENDKMKTSIAKDLSELKVECETKVYEKEKELHVALKKMDIMKDEYCTNLKHMQSKLDDAYKLLARKDGELKESNEHIDKLKVKETMLPNELQKELACVKDKNRRLSEKLEDKILIANNTVIALDAQKDLLLAKEEIIENFRKVINDTEKSCSCKQQHMQNEIEGINVTSNVNQGVDLITATNAVDIEAKCDDLNRQLTEKTKNLESMNEKHQELCNDFQQQIAAVSEIKEKYDKTCELLDGSIETNHKWEKKTGSLQGILADEITPIYNNVLVWLSTQLDTANEASICEKCMNHFVEEEIEIAKSALFEAFGGDGTVIGTKEMRRGGAKETKMMKDFKDIVDAMKKLQTSDKMNPLFVTSAEGIMKCPTIIPITSTIKDDAVVSKVSELEKTMSDFMKEQKKHNDRVNGRLESIQKENSVKKLAEQFKEMDTSLEAFKTELSAAQSGNGRNTSNCFEGRVLIPANRQYQANYNQVQQRKASYQTNPNQAFTGEVE